MSQHDPATIIHEVTRSPWRLGVLYYEPEDRRVIVPKRTRLGWTLNLARPESWLLIGLVLSAMAILRSIRPADQVRWPA